MRRASTAYLAGVAVVVAAYPLFPPPVRTWVFDLASLSAAPTMAVALRRRHPPGLLAWALVAAGQFCFFAGDALFDLYLHVLGRQPFPSVADVAYLAGYGCIAAGLVLLIRRRIPTRDVATCIDAAIVTVGAGVVSWVFVIVPYATDTTLGGLERLVSAAYPLGDLLLLALVARLLAAPTAPATAERLVAVGLLAHLVADTGYAAAVLFEARTSSTVLLDMGWLCGYGLLVAAALHPSIATVSTRPTPVRPTSGRRLVALTAAALISPAILAIQSVHHAARDGLVIAATSGVLVVLVMLRMHDLLHQLEVKSSELEARAHTDGLTGVLNRRGWDDSVAAAVAAAEQLCRPLTVVIIDLDRFKRFNDAHGHLAGDDLLREAVGAWAAELRPGDVLARYGGEEFAVALPDCRADHAATIVGRLQRSTPRDQTFSAGVAEWALHESVGQLVARADRALYQAKHRGRARVELSAPAGSRPVPPGPLALVT